MKCFKKEHLIAWGKRIVYGRTGEPYPFCGTTLRFVPGTRPVRPAYRNSSNANVRNDALQVDLIGSVLAEGDFAIDIGAHAGEYGVLMASRCGVSGKVACFEPDPDARALFERNFQLNPGLRNHRLYAAACSDRNGTATFYCEGGNAQSSFARTAIPQHRDPKEIEVETLRLDDWLATERHEMPKLVKIDTEGAEVHVLRGMTKILDSEAIVVCELHPFAWGEFGVSFEDLDRLVREHGRRPVWLDGSGEAKPPGEYGTVILERL